MDWAIPVGEGGLQSGCLESLASAFWIWEPIHGAGGLGLAGLQSGATDLDLGTHSLDWGPTVWGLTIWGLTGFSD